MTINFRRPQTAVIDSNSSLTLGTDETFSGNPLKALR